MRTVPALPPYCSHHAYVVAYPHASAPPSLTVCVLFPGFPPPLFADVPGGWSCPRSSHHPGLYTLQSRARPVPLFPSPFWWDSREVPGLCRPCLSPVGCCWDRDASCFGICLHSFLFPDATGSSSAAAVACRRVPARQYCSFSSPLPHPLRSTALTFFC